MSNTGWAVVIVGLVIILGLGWWMFGNTAPATPATSDTTAVVDATPGTSNTDNTASTTGADVDVSAGAGANAAKTTTIHYTASGFSPKNVTIARGSTVTFVNDTSGAMWVASDVHPTHTEFDGTDRATHCSGSYAGPTPFDQCQNGSTYSFVFNKAGSFTFHNHSAAQFGGTVTVQ
jgi:plastocyanin